MNYETYSSEDIEDLIEIYYAAAQAIRCACVSNKNLRSREAKKLEDLVNFLKAELDKRDGF